MCTGCDQLPEELMIVQTSEAPILGVAEGTVMSASLPLTVQPPLARLKLKVLCTALVNSAAVGRGNGRRTAGTTLGSGAGIKPWTLNFRKGTPGFMRLPVGPRPLVCSARSTR